MLFSLMIFRSLNYIYNLFPLFISIPISVNTLQANVFQNINVINVIRYLKDNQINNVKQYEADYSRLTSMILPFYFAYPYYYISPEQHLGENYHPDYVVGCPNHEGINIIKLILELKRDPMDGSTKSWEALLDQLWSQCDTNNSEIDGNGRIWCVAQRGLFICLFRWDLLRYQYNTKYTNFIPLIPTGWSIATFAQHGVEIETEIINGQEQIRLVFWDLNNPIHQHYLDGLFQTVVLTDA